MDYKNVRKFSLKITNFQACFKDKMRTSKYITNTFLKFLLISQIFSEGQLLAKHYTGASGNKTVSKNKQDTYSPAQETTNNTNIQWTVAWMMCSEDKDNSVC